MEKEIKAAQKLLKDALGLRTSNPTKATAAVAKAVRELMKLFPKAPVGPDFPETTTPVGGAGQGGGQDGGQDGGGE